ncbi:MAG: 16S rRNA (cytosine(1402)-N(4))-methyltransferase RsmH [Patescibacteria group bacterium]
MIEEHIPVLLKEVLDFFSPLEGKKIIDATLGLAGHSLKILESDAQVLGIEFDPEVIQLAKERLKSVCPEAPWQIAEANFNQIEKVATKAGFNPADGILFDLGISRWHYKKAQRGFSFEDDSLDMRLNPEVSQSALDIINHYQYEQLLDIFTKLVQERLAGPIAQALVSTRRLNPISSAKDLAELVSRVYQEQGVGSQKHPATKVFLALRILVNQEIDNLRTGLDQAVDLLGPGGRLAVISFHSGEDRLVKQFFKQLWQQGKFEKPKRIFPSHQETRENPLSRSAQLRTIVKKESS